MSPHSISKSPSREVVGLFADRTGFEKAVEALLGAGFARADLSVLSSHESLDAAGRPGKPWKDVLTALVGELKFEAPLVASGIVYLAGGPVAGTIAAAVGAAVGGVAIKEVLDEVTSTPHTEDFARAVEAGSVILWCAAGDDAAEARVRNIMTAAGARNVHRHGD